MIALIIGEAGSDDEMEHSVFNLEVGLLLLVIAPLNLLYAASRHYLIVRIDL